MGEGVGLGLGVGVSVGVGAPVAQAVTLRTNRGQETPKSGQPKSISSSMEQTPSGSEHAALLVVLTTLHAQEYVLIFARSQPFGVPGQQMSPKFETFPKNK